MSQIGDGTDDLRDDGNATQPDVPDGGAVLPRPLAAVDSLADDEWVIPTRLPDGIEFQYAADTDSGPDRSQTVLYGIGSSQVDQLILNASDQGPVPAGDVLDVDGTEWTVSGDAGPRLAARRVGEVIVTVRGLGSTDDDAIGVLAGLVVVNDAGLPEPPIVFGESMTEVGVFAFDAREFTVKADGSNGWFCTGLFSGSGWGGGCASFFDPAGHIDAFQSGGSEYTDGANEVLTNTSGLASLVTARVEVQWIDGTVTMVEPQNTSDRFTDVRFWATGMTIALEPAQVPDSLGESVVEVRAPDGDLVPDTRSTARWRVSR